MTLYKNKYRIESARLKGWNYSSPGHYFITICTKNRYCLFGNVETPKLGVSTGDNPDIKNTPNIGIIINQYKRICTIRIRTSNPGISVWQPRFHDHIIRDENELNRIRQYIINNPVNWGTDDNYITEGTP